MSLPRCACCKSTKASDGRAACERCLVAGCTPGYARSWKRAPECPLLKRGRRGNAVRYGR